MNSFRNIFLRSAVPFYNMALKLKPVYGSKLQATAFLHTLFIVTSVFVIRNLLLFLDESLSFPYKLDLYTKGSALILFVDWHFFKDSKRTEEELRKIEISKTFVKLLFMVYFIGIAFLVWFAVKNHQFFY